MTPELIISLISLGATFIVGILTIFANIRISKISHLESVKKYEKNITNFELQFKDEQWLYNLLESGEFDHYNMKSKKRIYIWWVKYSRQYPPVLLISHVNYNDLKHSGISGLGSTGKEPNIGGRHVEFVMPGDDTLPDPDDLF